MSTDRSTKSTAARTMTASFLLLAVLAACARDVAREEASGASTATALSGDSIAAERGSPVLAIRPGELRDRVAASDGPLLLDVRSPEEYAEGHIPGAVNIPYDALPDRLDEVERWKNRGIVVYCRTGRRAGIAEETLVAAGFSKVWDLEGHMTAWREAGRPTSEPVPCC
jgi:rhodanese-related sulfurtransferase